MWRIIFGILFCLLFHSMSYAQSSCNQPFELSTKGHKIIDQCGKEVHLKGVNWFGGHEQPEVPGGLDKQPLESIVALIKKGGFNSVRFTFSNEMLHDTKLVDPKRVAANPAFASLTPIQVFDKTVTALTDAGLMVILNNHTTTSEWCCGFDFNGLWHHPGMQTTTQWINDWVSIVARYRDNPLVVGADLRNEVRTARFRGSHLPVYPNWGEGNDNDWKLAATQAGNIVQEVNPRLLIIIEGINWYGTPMVNGYRPMLTPVKTNPVKLNHPNKLVYQAHVYGYTGPRHTGDEPSSIGQVHFRDMENKTLRKVLDDKFGFVTEEGHDYTAPVWIGEFGVSGEHANVKDKLWFHYFTQYLLDKDIGWSFWALNPIRANGDEEPFGLVNDDWSDFKFTKDWRHGDMKRLLK